MGEPLQVCHILSTFHPVVGGIQRTTERLCVALRAQGVNAVVLTRRQPGLPRRAEVAGIPVFRLGLAKAGKVAALSFALHAFWLLATRFRSGWILHVHSVDVPLLLGLVCKLLLRIPVVATIHGEMMIVEQNNTRIGRWRMLAMCRHVDRFTALSPEVERQLMDDGVPASRVHRIPNGVDESCFRPADPTEVEQARQFLGVRRDAVLALFVGRLIDLKHVDLLLTSWANLSAAGNHELLILGDGPERPALEAQATALAVRGVRFCGAQADVVPYLRAADIFVLPSRMEGLSVALLEAMGAGLGVVVSDLPGNLAVVQHDVNGLVVATGDGEALTRALDRLLGSATLRTRLGREASRTVHRSYSVRQVAALHIAMYAGVSNRGEAHARAASAAGPAIY